MVAQKRFRRGEVSSPNPDFIEDSRPTGWETQPLQVGVWSIMDGVWAILVGATLVVTLLEVDFPYSTLAHVKN